MAKLVINCSSAKDYLLKDTATGCTIIAEGKVVTITFDTPTSTFEIAELSNQVRITSIDVYTLKEKAD